MSVDVNHNPAQEQEPLMDRLKFAAKISFAGAVAVGAFLNAPDVINSVVDNVSQAVTPDYSNIDPLHLNEH